MNSELKKEFSESIKEAKRKVNTFRTDSHRKSGEEILRLGKEAYKDKMSDQYSHNSFNYHGIVASTSSARIKTGGYVHPIVNHELLMKKNLIANVTDCEDCQLSTECFPHRGLLVREIRFMILENYNFFEYANSRVFGKNSRKKILASREDFALAATYSYITYMRMSYKRTEQYYEIISLLVYEEVNHMLAVGYRTYKEELMKQYPSLFIEKGKAVYRCLDPNKSERDKKDDACNARNIDIREIISKAIMLCMGDKKNKYFTKRGGITDLFVDEVNKRLEKKGFSSMKKDTIRKICNDILGNISDPNGKQVKISYLIKQSDNPYFKKMCDAKRKILGKNLSLSEKVDIANRVNEIKSDTDFRRFEIECIPLQERMIIHMNIKDERSDIFYGIIATKKKRDVLTDILIRGSSFDI